VVDGGRNRSRAGSGTVGQPKPDVRRMIKAYPHVETERQGPVSLFAWQRIRAQPLVAKCFSLRDVTPKYQDDHTSAVFYLYRQGKNLLRRRAIENAD